MPALCLPYRKVLTRRPKVVDTLSKLEKVENHHDALKRIVVFGNTQGTKTTHPVIRTIVERWKDGSKPGKRGDNHKIALAIEGGGMRGCVSAGATAALHFLGLNDVFDLVYGSSAGAMIASYFIAKQFGGTLIYHDVLPSAKTAFIDKSKLAVAAGVPQFLLNLLLAKGKKNISIDDIIRGNLIKPSSLPLNESNVFNLDFLLHDVMEGLQPLDWDAFSRNEKTQNLGIVCTTLTNLQPLTLSRAQGNYDSHKELLACIRASMSVPGITGKIMAVDDHTKLVKPYSSDTNSSSHRGKQHPLTDGFLAEPMPYRSAISEGNATHVCVLRTRPDPAPILGKPAGLYERVIANRFLRGHGQDHAATHLKELRHHRIYAQDLLRLNEASHGPEDGLDVGYGKGVHILPIAPQMSREVQQLETKREVLYGGMKDGARRVLELFGPAMGLFEMNDTQELEKFVQMVFPDNHITNYQPIFDESLVFLEKGRDST